MTFLSPSPKLMFEGRVYFSWISLSLHLQIVGSNFCTILRSVDGLEIGQTKQNHMWRRQFITLFTGVCNLCCIPNGGLGFLPSSVVQSSAEDYLMVERVVIWNHGAEILSQQGIFTISQHQPFNGKLNNKTIARKDKDLHVASE